jgi:hypothetical protein
VVRRQADVVECADADPVDCRRNTVEIEWIMSIYRPKSPQFGYRDNIIAGLRDLPEFLDTCNDAKIISSMSFNCPHTRLIEAVPPRPVKIL